MVIGIVKVERIIATLLLAIAFCPYIGSTAMSAWISYGCVAVIIGCAIVKLISTKKNSKGATRCSLGKLDDKNYYLFVLVVLGDFWHN